jgi:hypothetical protein
MTLAQRLGTRDARLSYHAGMIAQAAGDDASATRFLREAVDAAPSLPLPYAASAQAMLSVVSVQASR